MQSGPIFRVNKIKQSNRKRIYNCKTSSSQLYKLHGDIFEMAWSREENRALVHNYAEAKCSYNKQFIAAQKLDDPSMHKLATSWIFNQPSSHKSIVKAEFEITQSYQRLNSNFFQSFTCNSDKNRLISPEE